MVYKQGIPTKNGQVSAFVLVWCKTNPVSTRVYIGMVPQTKNREIPWNSQWIVEISYHAGLKSSSKNP